MLLNEVIDVQRADFHVQGPGRDGWTDRDSSAFTRMASTAVFAPVHLPVVLECIDEPLFKNKLAFLFRDIIGYDQRTVIENANGSVFRS
jgi:hypothetical protein